MVWRTHALAGISSLWLLKTVPGSLTPENLGAVVVVAVVGSLLPDLDAASSKIAHVDIFGMKPLMPVSILVHKTFGHRGMLHSLIGLLIIAALATVFGRWWPWPVSVALVLGYASHLLMDACTPSGIPALFPRNKRYHALPKRLRITTGSDVEELLLAVLLVVALMLLISSYPFFAGRIHTPPFAA